MVPVVIFGPVLRGRKSQHGMQLAIVAVPFQTVRAFHLPGRRVALISGFALVLAAPPHQVSLRLFRSSLLSLSPFRLSPHFCFP
jgi:hypothetical protein